MVIANPRIHIICGVCGSKKDFTFKIERDAQYVNEGKADEYKEDVVYLSCGNCSTLTNLDELMEVDKKDED